MGHPGWEEIGMIANRELTMEDYVAMLRRRAKMILIPALLAPAVGYAVSYAFAPKYTSQSLILVEGQKVPESMVQPVVSEDLTARVVTLQQQVLSQSHLQPMIERLFPNKNSQQVGEMMDAIRVNMSVEPVLTDLSGLGAKKKGPAQSPVPGFYIDYTAPNAREAQQICNELTSLLLTENDKSVQAAATGTSDVLNKGLEDAKRNLDDMDAKLAEFKKQYVGQLPGDEENNLKILMGLNSQLEANTQTLNRAQQDKSYTESMLAQQLAAWKTGQSSTNPDTLEKTLSDLQAPLVTLRARYTDDHPDVIKMKADIAEIKLKLAEVNKASANPVEGANQKAAANEPPEIRQLRTQIHQYEDLIAGGTRDQKRLQQEIEVYKGRVSLSPAIEEQYKQLTRDYDNAQKDYQDLLAKRSVANLTVKMTTQSEGERMVPLNPANLPDDPSFPNRLSFAGGGLAAGLALGLGLAFLLELTDNSIRNEADVEAALELPILVTVPWVDAAGTNGSNGRSKFWHRSKDSTESKTRVRI
jgi:polysaccharide chain length determinant protein (PEP-CTERM system associated)